MIEHDRGGDVGGVLRTGGQILFGAGMSQQVGRVSAQFGPRVLICVDPAIQALGTFEEIRAGVEESGLTSAIFSGIVPELPRDTADEAAELGRSFRPDVIVAIGGGSCIDLAKVTGILLSHPGKLPDYYGELKVPGPIHPIVAVPTTSGTGSEVTPAAVVSDPDLGTKIGISSPFLIPRAAICDPVLSCSCPPVVSAHSGMDAMSHALEAYTSVQRPELSAIALDRVYVGKNALSDDLALIAIDHIASSLRNAVANGDDFAARASMMYGSLMAGLSFGVAGVNLAHALQYPIGAATKTPHGLGVATVLPYVVQFNLPHRMSALSKVAQVFGVGDGEATVVNAEAAVEYIHSLNADVGIPASLAAIGVERRDLPKMAEQTVKIARLVDNNPRPTTPDDLRAILDAAWRGDRDLLAR
jgi:alcohol dehydrogenase